MYWLAVAYELAVNSFHVENLLRDTMLALQIIYLSTVSTVSRLQHVVCQVDGDQHTPIGYVQFVNILG